MLHVAAAAIPATERSALTDLSHNLGGNVATAHTTITLDLAKAAASNHTYDGHGAIADSGSSRLLMDYPEPQRSQVLDYLYLPSFGASLHMLKVEVDGDVQSGIGTGASHRHHRHDGGPFACSRGNTAWLLREVKKRNPNVLTYGLPWGMPAWVGGGDYYSDDSIEYFVTWLRCQRSTANVTVDFLGLWNEPHWRSDYWGGANYTKALRKRLDGAGFAGTKLVLLDDAPQYAGVGGLPIDFLRQWNADAEFRDAVHAVGYHYCCDWAGGQGYAALKVAKPDVRLWQSEAHDGNWGQTLVTSYNNAGITAQIDWCLIWSAYYPEFVDGGSALFWAFEPWSGHYVLDTMPGGKSPIWKGAHFTQFTQPGWRYVDGANGNFSGGGAYLALASDAQGSEFSLMLQTHSNATCLLHAASPSQTVDVDVVGAWCTAGCRLSMWWTNATVDFIRMPDVVLPPLVDGKTRTLRLTLAAASTYTLSTVLSARKGRHPTPPARTPFPLPFVDDFEPFSAGGTQHNTNDTLARYISDNSGSFSVEVGAGKDGGSALKQRVTMDPDIGNGWINDQDPITQFGSHNWSDFSISVDAMIVKGQPLEAYADVPTAASLMPCTYGAQDLFAVGADGFVSQNGSHGACLSSAIRAAPSSTHRKGGRPEPATLSCDVADPLMNLQLMSCKTARAASHCGRFELDSASGQLKHVGSGLCATACGGQPWSCGIPSGNATASDTYLMEAIALLKPCQPTAAPSQKWARSNGQLTNGGKCLSTEARQPSLRPAYTSVCSRFFFMWGSNGAPQKGFCMEAYLNGSWILRGAGVPYLSAPGYGSEGQAVHGPYVLKQGKLPGAGVVAGAWHNLMLNASGSVLSGFFNGEQLFSSGPREIQQLSTNGQPALASSYHEVLFDNLRVEPIDVQALNSEGGEPLVKSVSIAPGGVSSQPFNPEGSGSPWCGQAGQRACAPKSSNYTYSAGLVLKPNSTVTVRSLGRWHSAFASRKHTLSLFFGGDHLTGTPGGAVPVVFNLSAVGAAIIKRALLGLQHIPPRCGCIETRVGERH